MPIGSKSFECWEPFLIDLYAFHLSMIWCHRNVPETSYLRSSNIPCSRPKIFWKMGAHTERKCALNLNVVNTKLLEANIWQAGCITGTGKMKLHTQCTQCMYKTLKERTYLGGRRVYGTMIFKLGRPIKRKKTSRSQNILMKIFVNTAMNYRVP